MSIIRPYHRFKNSEKNKWRFIYPVTLYRLLLGDNEPLVVDTKSLVNITLDRKKLISILKRDSNEYHIIEATTIESNIDEGLSELNLKKWMWMCSFKRWFTVELIGITPLSE